MHVYVYMCVYILYMYIWKNGINLVIHQRRWTLPPYLFTPLSFFPALFHTYFLCKIVDYSGRPSLQISSAGGATQVADRFLISSTSSTHCERFKAPTLFLSLANLSPPTSSYIFSQPFSHSPWALQSWRLLFDQSVQLQPLYSPFITVPTQFPSAVHTGVQGRHLAPLNGPLLDNAATGTPKRDGGKSYFRSVTTQKGNRLVA